MKTTNHTDNGTQSSSPSRTALPYLFLDVDGVLNAYDCDEDLVSFDDFVVHEVSNDDGSGFSLTFDLWLSKTMGEKLSGLPVEIVWLTTWGHNANKKISPLVGLSENLETLPPPSAGITSHGVWKLDNLVRHVKNDPRPFIWIDDELGWIQRKAPDGEASSRRLHERHLFIQPDPRTGISIADFDRITEFLADH